MARAKTKKSKAKLEGEKWVNDKIVQTIAKLRDMVQKLEKENKDIACENEALKETISKLETKIKGLDTTISTYLTKKSELEAQVHVLKELIKELSKNK